MFWICRREKCRGNYLPFDWSIRWYKKSGIQYSWSDTYFIFNHDTEIFFEAKPQKALQYMSYLNYAIPQLRKTESHLHFHCVLCITSSSLSFFPVLFFFSFFILRTRMYSLSCFYYRSLAFSVSFFRCEVPEFRFREYSCKVFFCLSKKIPFLECLEA